MGKQRYDKADLLWEAIRRNEDYKRDYYELARGKDVSRFERLQWNPYANYRWQVNGLLNPEISVDDIKREIAAGEKPEDIHPYYYMSHGRRTPVIQYHVPGSPFVPQNVVPRHHFTEHKDDRSLISMDRFIIKNRIMISIDPMAEDASIIKEIKRIKKEARMAIRDRRDELRKSGRFVARQVNIEQHIGWLKKYDEIVIYCLEKLGNGELPIIDGVFEIPKGTFTEFAKRKRPGGIADNLRRDYERAYKRAVEIIKVAPNLEFSASRTQQY